MLKEIKLGYEVGTAKKVNIPQSHLIVTGITQLSGKSTTIEALINRSDKKAIVFRTKIGETGFNKGVQIAPYFKEKSDWQYVQSLLEATLKERLKFERSWIIDVCKNAGSLIEVKANIDRKLTEGKLNSLTRSVLTTLQAYFEIILPQLRYENFSKILNLQDGINIMYLERYKEEIQSLVIRSVLETVLNEYKDTIVVIPEAWKFLPQSKGNPCKYMAESFIRQGATNGNFLWVDSQDMANIDKGILKQVSTWILGLQQERNEVVHTLDQIPLPKRQKPKPDEIMTLKVGHFYVCTPSITQKVYVQPAWLESDDVLCKDIAKGKTDVREAQARFTDRRQSSEMLLPKASFVDTTSQLEAQKIYAKVQQEMVELRQDFVAKLNEFQSYVVSQLNISRQSFNIDDIVNRVIQKMSINHSPQINKQEIISEVLRQIPRQSVTGAMTYEVSPLEKITKDFLQDIKQKVMQDINSLDAEEKKILKFVEVQGKGINVTNVLERCLLLSKTSGSSRGKVSQAFKKFESMEIARIDKAHGLIYSMLKDRIANLLSTFNATEQDIQQVYDHIMMELLK